MSLAWRRIPHRCRSQPRTKRAAATPEWGGGGDGGEGGGADVGMLQMVMAMLVVMVMVVMVVFGTCPRSFVLVVHRQLPRTYI